MAFFSTAMVSRLYRFGAMLALISLLSMMPLSRGDVAHATEFYPYLQTFTISAYYSPCEGQSRYATGSYEGDIRLNGNGTHGASGRAVFPGMIAAPSTYAFGTKMNIPGVGMTGVYDRGGAIVNAGERGELYDRLDIWMGWCDEGLARALNWGKKTVDVEVYGIDDSIEEQVYLEGFSFSEEIIKNYVLAPQVFGDDIWYLSTGEDVEELQSYLKELGYFEAEISGYYGDETRDAVIAFQLDNEIISNPDDFGAGHTGVNTRKFLDLAISRLKEDQEEVAYQAYQAGRLLLANYSDLNKNQITFARDLALGSSGDDVRLLQEELVNLGFLRIGATGYFGEVTEHALFKFQQKRGIVTDKDSPGAGVFGPQTRTTMNAIIDARTTDLSYIAYNRSQQDGSMGPDSLAFARVLTFGDRGADVKILQSLLRDLGFFGGAFLTEFYGEQTKAAVQAFQVANNLIDSEGDPDAGQVNQATLDLLNQLI